MAQSDPILIRLYKAGRQLVNYLNQKPFWHTLFEFIQLSVRKVWTIIRVLFLNHYFRGVVVILRTVWLIVLILFIGIAFLTLMDQARDVLEAMVEPSAISTWRTFIAFLVTFLCSLSTWYFTRIVFVLKNQQRYVEVELVEHLQSEQTGVGIAGEQAGTGKVPDGRGGGELTAEPMPTEEVVPLTQKTHIITTTERGRAQQTGDEGLAIDDTLFKLDDNLLKVFTRWTPLALGAIPMLTLMLALSDIKNSGIHIAILIALFFPYVLIAYFSQHYVRKSPNAVVKPMDETEVQSDDRDIQGHSLTELLPIHLSLIAVAFLFSLTWFILSTWWESNMLISRSIGPVAIVFLGLTVQVFVASVLIYLDYLFNTPLTLMIIILAAFLHNNNHQIRTLDHRNYYSKDRYDSLKIAEHFRRWLDYRIDTTTVKDSVAGPDTLYPVYLIAAEGGGVRAAHWTASVLAKLQAMDPRFFRHVFAISGASGGSVGASMFTALYRDSLVFSQDPYYATHQTSSLLTQTQSILKNDFLSPLVAAFFAPDLVQKFLPLSINSFDRAQYLEDSFSSAYYQNVNPGGDGPIHFNSLDSAFTDLWRIKNTYELPALFLNTTRVETGQKGILTHLQIANNPYFTNIIDVQDTIHQHIPYNTAAFISARFPLVTPPATVRQPNDPSEDWSSFVDGGYIDNSALETTMAVLSSILNDGNPDDKSCPPPDAAYRKLLSKVKFRVIFIKNSAQSDERNEPQTLKGFYEVTAPAKAFFNSWDNNLSSKYFITREYLKGKSSVSNQVQVDPQLYILELDRKNGTIPLGWALSPGANARINDQIKNLDQIIGRNRQNKALLKGLAIKFRAN
ncbi:patatin-like phospholipase family protein [Spirosoma endbachense]|uniref:PNPLA domain-containing protein n=1 Tax=Spirosoma endbachense TaxID=2666025 RepID=A0A6P1VZZ2_9BACT|nr:patatin-like phospholipase family protein [Spirosoma endbachense]QHV97888.1 hypothetical protein GJR95_24050 [Spirosoma endbachense]